MVVAFVLALAIGLLSQPIVDTIIEIAVGYLEELEATRR